MSMNKSRTMRIDLIPEISPVPLSESPKTAIISPSNMAKAREQAAAASQNRDPYSDLFQNIYDAAIVTDLRGRIRDVNPRAIDAFWYSPDDFSFKNIKDIIAGCDDELIRALYENLKNECFTLMQASCIRGDGTAFPAEISVSQLRLSTPHLCFFIRDETIRRQADEMLLTEHNALQNASSSIVVIDMNSIIEYANPATARLWSIPADEEIVGKYLGDLFLNSGDAEPIVSSLLGEYYESTGVVVAVRQGLHGEEPFRVGFSAACNRDSDGNVVGAVLSFTDLTDEDRVKTAERDAMRFRETLKRLDEFRQALLPGVGEICSLVRDFSAAKIVADDDVKRRLVSAVDACAGIHAILGDVEDLIAEAKVEEPEAEVTAAEI
ncbi:MAG: PAS domain-containing protein [Kiritimatiellia bacterium]|jgi:PAS domain S-box-containing protein